jgi:DNA-binding FadR family transcriptional regulator
MAGARRAVTEEAIARIREMIVAGQLAPGDRLPREGELAAALGLGRSSLREAVRALALAGVLESRPGAGTYVTSLSSSRLLEPAGQAVPPLPAEGALQLFEVRRMLEPAATELAAARMTEPQLRELERLLERCEQAAEAADRVALPPADQEFHGCIVGSVGNAVLQSLHENLSRATIHARLWSTAADWEAVAILIAEHREIFSALEARDPALARTAATRHLTSSERWLRRALAARTATGGGRPSAPARRQSRN